MNITRDEKETVRKNAPALIVIYNHPSGDPTPSHDDVAVTRTIVEAGKLLDVKVLDHLIIGMNRSRSSPESLMIFEGKWVSLKERGLGFV